MYILLYVYILNADGFFFQAEDGIRAGHVTGVQTCALPIFLAQNGHEARLWVRDAETAAAINDDSENPKYLPRSEERRVGKECRSKGAEYYSLATIEMMSVMLVDDLFSLSLDN